MEIYTSDVTAARSGAAFLGVCSPLAGPAFAGADHARTQNPIPAAAAPVARHGALPSVPAMPRLTALLADEPVAVNDTRKQNVQKTRMNAGGYGAMGPHPEREPAY
ncbi:MAG TPA: hypothetical protein VHF26_13930 [Trebonia sp.]|nr:hypothetical protein [Trebonia sp.]